MENLIGKTIDNYKIVSVLGKGGMGIVYKAYDTKLDRYVAIKMLTPQMTDKIRFIDRFKREAKNHAKLSHPNIVTVYGFIEYSDFLGIVMEYVEGESLDKVLQRQGRIHLYDIIYIMRQVLYGLGYAHKKGFVHRDIKPSNIMLNKEGITKIMDFGISKSLFDKDLTKTGSKVGTVFYMSPEQVKGLDVTHLSDVYSLGCTLYEMAAGNPPFNFETEYEIMEAQIKKKPTRIGDLISNTPDVLDKIILKMMDKNPNSRYLDCEDVQSDLAELEKNVSKLQTSYFQKRVNSSPRTKLYSILMFSGMLVLLLGLSWFVYNQVDGLLKSNQLEKFKKYSVESLFAEEGDSLFNKKIHRLNSDVNSNFNSIVFADSKTSFAVGDSGTVVVSRDTGKTWQSANINSKVLLNDVFSFRSGKCFVVGDSATLLMSKDYLASYIDVPTMQMRDGITFFNIYFKNENLGFITGNNGIILKTMNGGMNWKQVITNSDNLLYDIVFTDDKSGFAVGWDGTILKTTDSGETWIKIDSNSDTYLKSIDFNMNGYGIIVGGNGTLLRTTDYGRNWKKQNINIQGGLQKVKFINENYVIALGIKGTILISNDSGENWKQLKTKVYSNLNSLAISPSGDIFIAGINGTIIKLL